MSKESKNCIICGADLLKSHPLRIENLEKWEEKFDEQFCHAIEMSGLTAFKDTFTGKEVKIFIQTLLESVRKEENERCRKRVEGMKKTNTYSPKLDPIKIGYNIALSDLLKSMG